MCASNMLYRIPSPLGEKVARGRMRGHKGTVASHQCLSVIPQQFRYDFRGDVFWDPRISAVARS